MVNISLISCTKEHGGNRDVTTSMENSATMGRRDTRRRSRPYNLSLKERQVPRAGECRSHKLIPVTTYSRGQK